MFIWKVNVINCGEAVFTIEAQSSRSANHKKKELLLNPEIIPVCILFKHKFYMVQILPIAYKHPKND